MLGATKLIAACSALLGLVLAAPAPGEISRLQGLTAKQVKLLTQFGYLPSNSGSALDKKTFEQGVRQLQAFAGLPVTGQLDSDTRKMLEADRCGMPDVPEKRSGSFPVGEQSIGRFTLQGSVWEKAKQGEPLTYKVLDYTNDLPREKQRGIMKTAFDMWQAASSLIIIDVTDSDPAIPDDNVDILISFVSRDHGDGYDFDGSGGTLAHAFYPHNNRGLSGDAHFDDDEQFTTETKEGINLDWVAVHEFGHSLGLEHSKVKESIMYPWYKGYIENIELTTDDIQGIQAIYGKPTDSPSTMPPSTTQHPSTTTTQTSTTTQQPSTTELPTTTQVPTTTQQPSTTTQPPSPGVSDECSVLSYDAFFNGVDGKTYAVAGAYYWLIKQKRQAGKESGPHLLTSRFPGLQTPVDAAFSKGKITVFFKGSNYWQYSYSNNTFTAVKTAQNLSDYGLPSNLNAALVFRKKIYLFKGGEYWKFSDRKEKVHRGYPRLISSKWSNLETPVDSAMTWATNKAVYFFKGEDFFKISKRTQQVQPGYPKKISTKWMGCGSVGELSLEP